MSIVIIMCNDKYLKGDGIRRREKRRDITGLLRGVFGREIELSSIWGWCWHYGFC